MLSLGRGVAELFVWLGVGMAVVVGMSESVIGPLHLLDFRYLYLKLYGRCCLSLFVPVSVDVCMRDR